MARRRSGPWSYVREICDDYDNVVTRAARRHRVLTQAAERVALGACVRECVLCENFFPNGEGAVFY